MGSTKPLYPSSYDPELRNGSPRYVAAGTNSCPPSHILEKHFSSPSEESHPRFNALNKSRPRSSALLNVNDPMAMHLLVETAIVDSNVYEILSFEEVDELKKEHNFLTNRIDASKRKLALESKVRDAALSLSRLYSNKKARGRRSLLGGVSDVTKHTDEELTASNRKCEDLSQELWRLSNRAVEIQRRLLQHSAGILGMTHQSSIQQRAYPSSSIPPGSPSSQYTLVNRNVTNSSLTVEFDDRSFYRTPDKLDDFGGYDRRSSYTKFPQLDTGGASRRGSATIDDPYLGRRLEDLNIQVRNIVLQLTSAQGIPLPQHLQPNGSMGGGSSLQEQLTQLEQSINFIQQHPAPSPTSPGSNFAAQELERTDTILSTLWDMLILGEEEVRSQKRALRQEGQNNELEYPDSEDEDEDQHAEYSISTFSAKVQALYTRATTLREERTMLRQQNSQQRSSFEAESAALKEKHSSREDNLSHELSTLSSQLDAMSNIVEQREKEIMVVETKSKALSDELAIIRSELEHRRLEAHRQSEDSSGHGQSDLEEERRARFEAEEALCAQLKDKEELLMALQGELEEAREDRDIMKVELDALTSESNDRLKKLETELAALVVAKSAAEEAGRSAQSELEVNKSQMSRMDEEMRGLEGKVAELSTEVAMLKAELDSAYGSKSQRAAETAQARAAAAALEAANKGPQTVDPGLLQEVEALATKNYELMEELALLKATKSSGNADLEKRCKVLQAELDGMLADFENLTKQSIENENDRIKLEGVIDGLRDRCETLETSLADERVRWLGMRTPSADGKLGTGRYGDGESTSTHVLKTEFKKMMRDMRSESMKTLRAEQEHRRHLEQQIRAMKQEAISRRGTVSSAKASIS
ncbi:hypothetical protein P167DRAFT_579512 [Morchella conica CCBAS932]|uniref:Uncharacterized protein n=1 Tax=Morchella conica CCBAS932 TaxID=1392247 RepID=A0A3N4KD04_9PEZI|nr:hypothetical protein P167DRAFT_579512 [Morchella conica CCBAS932]